MGLACLKERRQTDRQADGHNGPPDCEATKHFKSWEQHNNEDAVRNVKGYPRHSPCTSWCNFTNEIISIIRVRHGKVQDGHNKWIPICDFLVIWSLRVTLGSGHQETSFVFWFLYLSESIYFKWNSICENDFSGSPSPSSAFLSTWFCLSVCLPASCS